MDAFKCSSVTPHDGNARCPSNPVSNFRTRQKDRLITRIPLINVSFVNEHAPQNRVSEPSNLPRHDNLAFETRQVRGTEIPVRMRENRAYSSKLCPFYPSRRTFDRCRESTLNERAI